MADRRLLLAALLIAPALVWGVPRFSWFKAEGSVGSSPRSFLVTMSVDSIPVYSGNHRKAPGFIAGQTFPAIQVSLEASYQGKDTSFWWSSVQLFRAQGTHSPLPEPIWSSVVRGGWGENDWSRIRFSAKPAKVEFHSPIYGDGEHPLDAGVLPEESIFLIATRLAGMGGELHFKVMAPSWELPYTRKIFAVKAMLTGQRLKIDDVEAVLVRFERDDGAAAEFWISSGGLKILRARTFRSLLLERIQ